MDYIIDPTDSFDFSKLSLAHPTGIQGGAYFTRIQYNSKPLYIKTLKSCTRQGFVKAGKKYYADLMFDKSAEPLITWFENLEEKCQKLILDKSTTWFQNPLELSDIENAFSSIIRIYKSGKFYLVRGNVKNNALNEPVVKIYDEDENPLSVSDITPESEFISILEIQGIKFTSRNFLVEIEIKQCMIIKDEEIFESCLLKSSKLTNKQKKIENNDEPNLGKIMLQNDSLKIKTNNIFSENVENTTSSEKIIESKTEENKTEPLISETNNNNISDDDEDEEDDNDDFSDDDSNGSEDYYKETLTIKDDETLGEDDLGFTDLTEKKEEKTNDDLKELDLDTESTDNLETLTLKKPNQVYFELYKDARNKAKEAKKAAIIAFLEAKNIKKTYMLDNLNESDSDDIDAEIDEVTENELEGL
jgi:hypothetical protein